MAYVLIARRVPRAFTLEDVNAHMTSWINTDRYYSWMSKGDFALKQVYYSFQNEQLAMEAYNTLIAQGRYLDDTKLLFTKPQARVSRVHPREMQHYNDNEEPVAPESVVPEPVAPEPVVILKPVPVYLQPAPSACVLLPFDKAGSMFWIEYWDRRTDLAVTFDRMGVRMMRLSHPGMVTLLGSPSSLDAAVAEANTLFCDQLTVVDYTVKPEQLLNFWNIATSAELPMFYKLLPVATCVLQRDAGLILRFYGFCQATIQTAIDFLGENLKTGSIYN